MRFSKARKKSNGEGAPEPRGAERQPATPDSAAQGPPAHPDTAARDTRGGLPARLEQLERQNRRMRLFLLSLFLAVAYLAFAHLPPDNIIVRQVLMESEQLKILDSSGNTRMFLRMYSRVPMLQLLDSRGKPRLSMGMRFDDTPFIDMSDSTGRTRATFEMTEKDEPTIRLYDEEGKPSFTIN